MTEARVQHTTTAIDTDDLRELVETAAQAAPLCGADPTLQAALCRAVVRVAQGARWPLVEIFDEPV